MSQKFKESFLYRAAMGHLEHAIKLTNEANILANRAQQRVEAANMAITSARNMFDKYAVDHEIELEGR